MSTTRRPVFITFLTVIGVLQGLLVLLLGIFLVADRSDADLLTTINDSDIIEDHQITENILLTVGIIGIVLGVVVIAASLALSKGSDIARWIVGLGSISIAANGLYALVALDGEQQATGAFSLTFAIFTLWYLFSNDQAEAFFAEN